MPPAESLLASNLFFSPMLIDKSPWSEGGIEVVGNVPLADGHVLERYSFRMRRGPNRDVLSYLGPDLKQTPELIEPAIEYVLTNVLTLDLAISAVLGLSEPVAAPALPASIDEAVELVELDEDTIVCVTVQAGNEELLALGGRINERWAQAYMNGYNWEALIHAFVASRDPDLASAVQPDAEADMYSASMSHSPENLDRMRQFEALIREMLADEQALFAFIEGNEIPWD